MITITQNEKTLVVNIKLSIGYNFNLRFERSCDMDARLLVNQIQNDLNHKISSMRKEAYELGWKDAKGKKKPKRTWFNGNINSDRVD